MRKLLCFALLACLTMSGCAGCAAEEVLPEGVLLRVIFLDVGQGDCTLLRTRGGDVLIDAGADASQKTLCRKLESLGVERLALAIFTHPDEDHIGGADEVLMRFPADEIWVSDAVGAGEVYERFLAVASRCKRFRRVSDGAVRRIGDVAFGILPVPHPNVENMNAQSLVLRITCGSAHAIFTGDIGAKEELAITARYGKPHLACDLYKVGHHGSSTSSAQAFLETMAPTYAVISCGADNAHGFPHGDVLGRLADLDVEVYRTDLSGDIIFDCDGKRFVPTGKNER